jgi:hypothetical protein
MQRGVNTSNCDLSKAVSIEVVHGRLREKHQITIEAGTGGKVQAVNAVDGSIEVGFSITVKDSKKDVCV